MRFRLTALRLPRSSRVTGANSRRDVAPDGDRSHIRAASPRSRYAGPSTASWRAVRRRWVVRPGRTSSRQTAAGWSHPNRSRAMRAPRRCFSSCLRSVSSIDVSSDLTSTTSRVRDDGCQASTSIDPLSRSIAYETSGWTSQPSLVKSFAIQPTMAAWPSSSRRSISPPRHRTNTTISASNDAPWRRSFRTSGMRPRSARDTSSWVSPEAVATSTWRHPKR